MGNSEKRNLNDIRLAKLEIERQETIKKAAPDKWQFAQPEDFGKFMRWREKIWLKIRTSEFIGRIPLLNRITITTPLFYTLIFYPNNRLGIKAIPQDLKYNTIQLKTRTMQVDAKKIWLCGENSVLLYNHNNANPLDVENTKIGAYTINPVLYKENLECNHVSRLLQPQEQSVTNKILLYCIVGVAMIVVFILAKQMGWI